MKLPNLPSDWEYVSADDPPPAVDPAEAPKLGDKNVGSVLRQVSGPPEPTDGPSFLSGFLKPTAEKTFDMLVPHTPRDVGIFAASLIFGGAGGPLARVAGKLAPEALPMIEGLGASAMRRIGGTALGGMLGSQAQGENPLVGGGMGVATQIGAEGVSKLSKWLRMNSQATALAQEDPEKLGEVVQQIIPDLKDIRSAKDFHAAFKKDGAQTVIAKAYGTAMDDVSQKMQGQLIPSAVMSSLRGPAKAVTPNNPAWAGQTASSVFGGAGQPGKFTFDDIAETIRRLRYQGWNGDELARGMIARDARQTAKELEQEVLPQLPTDVAEKYSQINESYSRGKRLIDFLDDKSLLDGAGNLNIPRLQKKLKSDGYSVGDSLQIAADAASLEKSLFRGGSLMEDTPGAGFKFNTYLHAGFFPSVGVHGPTLPGYAGRSNWGLNPGDSSQLVQFLKRGTERKPISLTAPEDEETP
jgi:hypothetical protein